MVSGQSIEPAAVYLEVFQRVQNTDTSNMTTRSDDPGYLYNQIAITNSALLIASANEGTSSDHKCSV
jgi:hypothetical protein